MAMPRRPRVQLKRGVILSGAAASLCFLSRSGGKAAAQSKDFSGGFTFMLNIPQLAQIKGRDPYLYESLKQVVGAVNSIGLATGVDPSGSIAAPDSIGGISVTAADGIFDIAITDNSAVRRGIFYFVESDTTQSFAQPHVYFLGSSRNLRVSLGNQTLYWRGYSQYTGSAPSPSVTFGSPATAVTGGGVSGPAPQPSSGSGTATGQQGGSGFGTSQTQNVDATLA
jgi:hypothetical protein